MTLASEIASPGSLIRAARLFCAKTQEEFAASVKSRQSLISKYERDLVDPPGSLVIHCMHLLRSNYEHTVTEESLIRLIRERLSGDEHAAARAAIASLVSGIR